MALYISESVCGKKEYECTNSYINGPYYYSSLLIWAWVKCCLSLGGEHIRHPLMPDTYNEKLD